MYDIRTYYYYGTYDYRTMARACERSDKMIITRRDQRQEQLVLDISHNRHMIDTVYRQDI